MDQKSAFIKDQRRRCSPRFTGASPRKTTKTKSGEPRQTNNTKKATAIAVTSLDSQTTSPCVTVFKEADTKTPEKQKQGSKPSTPTSSSVQRELKKIEDYWTRQDPVKTDSPRLRYHKTRDTDSDDARLKNTEKTIKDTETEKDIQNVCQECLPESPIPSCKTDNLLLVHEGKDSESSFIQKPDELSKAELGQNREEGECNDEDVEYLPPRKKLRSEVKQEELWEGFPLTVTFKRLTPRCKQNENTCICKTGEVTAEDEEKTGFENENNELVTNCNHGNRYDTTEDNESAALTMGEKVKCRNIFENMAVVSTRQITNSTVTVPTLKRSARLQEKNRKTPIKNEEKSQNKVALTLESLNIESQKKGREGFPCGDDLVSDINEGTDKSSEKNEMINRDTEQSEVTLSCEEKLSPLPNKEDNGQKYTQSECAGMSISQILSCDSQVSLSDDVPEVADTVEIELESIGIHDGYKTTEDKLVERKLDCEEILEGNDKFAEQDTGTYFSSAADKPSSNDIIKSDSSYTPTTSKVAFHENASPQEEKVQDNDIKQSGKGKKGSCLFTVIKHNDSPKIKKVPPLKIKLKNTSKRSKYWTVKTKKGSKKLKNKKCTVTENDTVVTESAETSELKETSKDDAINSKSKGKKKVINKPTSDSKQVPGKKKQKKKSNKDQLKRSPPPKMNLRLNSERRLSMVNGLLSNKVLNNHACVIWSSENRRHMHLSYPDATPSELDDLLREKWTQLCEKEKIRYFQRAWNASKDENKHSSRRHDKINLKQDPSGNPSIERFLNMNAKTQHAEIKEWLQFYYDVSLEVYNEVINQFRASLHIEKKDQEQAEKGSNSKPKSSKKCKTKKQNQKVYDTDTEAKHRRLMFEAILRHRQDILEIWADKRETQSQQLKESFDKLVRKLVAGEEVHLTRNVKSSRLMEVLADLRELEKHKKLTVSGAIADRSAYFNLLNEVDVFLNDKMKPSSLLDSLDDTRVDHETVERYLRGTNKLDEHKMPILNAVAIKHVLDDANVIETGRRNNLSIYKKPVPLSPPSILTEWVAEDIIRIHPNLGFRSAVSLLSNKVHHGPAFVTPTVAEQVGAQSASGGRRMHSILRANNNQNCYKTVTYTFARDRHLHPFISRLKTCGQNHVIGHGNN